jgi:hypothetical protein
LKLLITDKTLNNRLLKHDKIIYLTLILFGIGMILIASTFSPAESNAPDAPPLYSGVKFPADYQTQFVHYATVQRSDGTIRNLYINPEALDFVRQGYAFLPDHTVIVIDSHYALKTADGEYQIDNAGHYVDGEPFEMLHVVEKRADWATADFVSENRIGNWNFGSFDPATGGYFDENMSDCFHCHNATAQTDFIYSTRFLSRYLQTGEVQYFVCNLPDRIAC